MEKLFNNVESIKNLVRKFLKDNKLDKINLSYLEKKGVYTVFSWTESRVPENFKLLVRILIECAKGVRLNLREFLRILFQGYGYLLARKIHWRMGESPEFKCVKKALRCAIRKFKLQHSIKVS
ncbi:MAG: hypothetical protein LBE20_01595 [Deltaproteobacteria bacterium]|jgi:hypothetical protein|nr:hypothetical protein [Deltaproteobacteria bacterium]